MKATFIRVIEAQDKDNALREAIADFMSLHKFEVDPTSFAAIPGSPFSYWVGDAIRMLFRSLRPLEADGRVARRTNGTTDDTRWIRTTWEVDPCDIECNARWVAHVKGGAFSPYYADPHLVIGWDPSRETYPGYLGTVHRPDVRPASLQYFLRPGLTWPRRTNGLSFRAMPKGCIFGDKGPGVFVDGDNPNDLLALCAVVNSAPFGALVALQLARTELAQSYEAGLIQKTPVPNLDVNARIQLAALAHRAWSLKHGLDTRNETSHAFVLPPLLQASGRTLQSRAEVWRDRVSAAEAKTASIQGEIDELSFSLYGIDDEDRRRIELGFGGAARLADAADADDDPDENDEPEEVDAAPLVTSLLSWSLGVAFGRFDVRLLTGEHEPPGEPEPFDPLPRCSPGIVTGADGLPVAAPPRGYPINFPRDGVLVDDQGHERDLVTRARQVFGVVFSGGADARWREAAEILDSRGRDLRAWFARRFFEDHIKRYSKSRRKAPIYWQLATPSASYSVWIYYHRFTRDTLYRVLHDYVTPKLMHEERRLASLTQDARTEPSASQRKVIDTQEGFIAELRAFREEVARVAPLWNPDLNDGVIINFAPLWRLVPQNRSWQKECKKVWDKLAVGDYDWARLAMHLWPERVVPKCPKDRSLAIAHGLEEVFWEEDAAGKWQPRKVSKEEIARLVEERTSPAVKSALDELLRVPHPTAPSRARRGASRRGRAKNSRTPASRPASRNSAATGAHVDNGPVEAVKQAIASGEDGVSKSDILEATGISTTEWNAAISALLGGSVVTKTGAGRGARYHLANEDEHA